MLQSSMQEEACPLTYVADTKMDTSITLDSFQMPKVQVDKPTYTENFFVLQYLVLL